MARVKHSRQIDAIAWALFFIWVGIALLAGISWAWSLVGISAIMLGAQVMLYRGGDKVDGFWAACGLVFLVAGLWEFFGLTWSLAPVVFVLVGLAMLANALFGAPAHTPRA